MLKSFTLGELLPCHFFNLSIVIIMRFATFLCPLAFAAFIRAATVPTQSVSSEYEVHERREALHPRWTKRDRVQGHKVLPMRVGLAKTSLDSGYEYLMDM